MWKKMLSFVAACMLGHHCNLQAAHKNKDAYEFLKESLSQGHIQKAKRTLGMIRSKMINQNDRYIYFQALVNFIDGNYSQVEMDLGPLDQFGESPYFGKICHLAWLNTLYLGQVQPLRKNKSVCQGILSKENNANLYWHSKVSTLKLDQMSKPWDSTNIESMQNHLVYRPIGGPAVTAQAQVDHLRQWLKLKYYHHQEKDLSLHLPKIPQFLFFDNEIKELMDLIHAQNSLDNHSAELAESEILSKKGLNASLLELKPKILNGEWEESIVSLESLWNDYPYSFKINTLLTLLYWLTGKTTESLFKIQHMQNTFPEIPTDLTHLSASVLMESGKINESKQVLYLSHPSTSDQSNILKNNIWQWIGIAEQNHNLVFQASSMACDLGDKDSCPLSYSYWRKTDELSGPPPSIDD